MLIDATLPLMTPTHLARLYRVLGDEARLGLVEQLLRDGPMPKSDALRAVGGGAPRYDRLRPLVDADVLEIDGNEVRVRDPAATQALLQEGRAWIERLASSISRANDAELQVLAEDAKQDPDSSPL